ncbi:LOW QUALITY PROTEIN: hypothetical protein HMPREF0005_05922, partial [Achromobacter xylosoxidans C54]
HPDPGAWMRPGARRPQLADRLYQHQLRRLPGGRPRRPGHHGAALAPVHRRPGGARRRTGPAGAAAGGIHRDLGARAQPADPRAHRNPDAQLVDL